MNVGVAGVAHTHAVLNTYREVRSFQCLPRDTIREISGKSEKQRHNHDHVDDGSGSGGGW